MKYILNEMYFRYGIYNVLKQYEINLKQLKLLVWHCH